MLCTTLLTLAQSTWPALVSNFYFLFFLQLSGMELTNCFGPPWAGDRIAFDWIRFRVVGDILCFFLFPILTLCLFVCFFFFFFFFFSRFCFLRLLSFCNTIVLLLCVCVGRQFFLPTFAHILSLFFFTPSFAPASCISFLCLVCV
jgi:hypothetical protein